MYRADAPISRRDGIQAVRGAINSVAAKAAASTRNDAGSRRRTRRAQNAVRSLTPRGGLRSRCDVIKKPEMTKKTSTPMKPPCRRPGQRWYSTTMPTAIARKAWMSVRTAVLVACDREFVTCWSSTAPLSIVAAAMSWPRRHAEGIGNQSSPRGRRTQIALSSGRPAVLVRLPGVLGLRPGGDGPRQPSVGERADADLLEDIAQPGAGGDPDVREHLGGVVVGRPRVADRG